MYVCVHRQVVSRGLVRLQVQWLHQGRLQCRLAMIKPDASCALIFDGVGPQYGGDMAGTPPNRSHRASAMSHDMQRSK